MKILNHYYRDSVQPPQSPFLFFKNIFLYLFGCTRSYLQHVQFSSLTRDQTWVPYIGSRVLTTRQPGKSLIF